MSLLNKEFPYILTYSHDNLIKYLDGVNSPSSGLSQLYDFIKKNDIWYCHISTKHSLELYNIDTLLGKENYDKVVNKLAYIVIDLSFEPFLDAIDVIYTRVVKAFNIPSSQIIFMSNMNDAAQYNKLAATQYGEEPIKIFYFSSLEYQNFGRLLSQKYSFIPFKFKECSKKFLNLNRRWRSHRPLMTALLHSKNLLDQGHISFGPCEHARSWDNIWENLKHISEPNPEMKDALIKSESIKSLPWRYLDTGDLDTNKGGLEDTIKIYFEDSYFSLISETTFFTNIKSQNSRFLTEKTFNAIAMRHPFILITIPNSLEVLKSLGYKTFSPWIDESYDKELDDTKRMMKILNEVERLCNLPKDEFITVLKELSKICEYNYFNLKRKKKFIIDEDTGDYV